jgi:hypothetical protein
MFLCGTRVRGLTFPEADVEVRVARRYEPGHSEGSVSLGTVTYHGWRHKGSAPDPRPHPPPTARVG